MSVLSSIEPLMCDKCPFLDCYEKGTCYECNCHLDNDVNVENHCDHKTYPPDCPLRNGMVISIKEEDGKLVIGKDYQ